MTTIISWRDVLTCKKWYGHIENIWRAARDVDYRYFEWNGRIYEVKPGGAEDTGILSEELNIFIIRKDKGK